MNLKEYYKTIADKEKTIEDAFVLIISLATPNGGREGIVSEVNRATAAKMIVDQQARLATPEEAGELRRAQAEQKRQADIAALEERVRMARLAEDELRALKKALRPARKGE